MYAETTIDHLHQCSACDHAQIIFHIQVLVILLFSLVSVHHPKTGVKRGQREPSFLTSDSLPFISPPLPTPTCHAPLYTLTMVMRNRDHRNIETSNGHHPMKIQISFMCGPRLLSVMQSENKLY